MKNILKSRRGVMIEGAILFVVVIFIFSILLTSVVMTAHSRANLSYTLMKERLALEQIGEYFVIDTAESDTFEAALNATSYERADTADNILHLKTASGKTVLYIELDTSGNPLSWRYGE